MKITGNKNKLILTEITVVKDDKIKQAIRDMRKVRIYYDDHKDVISKTKGYATRYILPVAYGLLRNGKKAVRAYQTAGSTKRGVPKWKLFLVDNIVDWQNSTRSFKKYKQALIDLGLNVNGDKQMTTLYAITPFANPDVQVSKYSHEISPEPLVKTDITPTTLNQQHTNSDPKKMSVKALNPIHSIDNINNIDYNKDTEAPETKPITKNDIKGAYEEPKDNNTQISNSEPIQEPTTEPTTEPVTKQDINGEENADSSIEGVKNRFNDMMDRMNNLYKDNEENNI